MDIPEYIANLNRNNYEGYCIWRLPALEEVKSLMEPKINKSNFYIDPIFDGKYEEIWTADIYNRTIVWQINFYRGNCILIHEWELENLTDDEKEQIRELDKLESLLGIPRRNLIRGVRDDQQI